MRSRRLGALLATGAIALLAASPALAAEPPCDGDECQGPPPAPQEIVPATSVVAGPENPPVRFEKTHHPKKHHKAHKGKGHKGHNGGRGHKGGKKRSDR